MLPTDSSRFLSSPTRLDGLRLGHVASLVSVDALVRWCGRSGERVEWVAATLAGDLGGQRAFERALDREGHDRESLGRDEFVERVRRFEADGRTRLEHLLGLLEVEVDLAPGALDAPDTARAATTAFVRLYEAGLLTRDERVVHLCPRCQTVVDPVDATRSEVERDVPVVRLPACATVAAAGANEPMEEGAVVVDLALRRPELLFGAVAVAVPADDQAVGGFVALPLGGGVVSVVAAQAGLEPVSAALVVPAHDADDLELARSEGLAPISVIDADGVVVAGPFAGLPQHAARAAAAEAIEAEGIVVGSISLVDHAWRCKRCATQLVSVLGQHWFLAMADLELRAADATREAITFVPSGSRERFQERAGQGGDWCLSHQVFAGQAVPAATCLDCGALSVGVDVLTQSSCGRCMGGSLVPDGGVLDARFVGSVWPLATSGWPSADRGPADDAERTTLVVGRQGLWKWALPMASLGLRLAGALPFGRVVVLDLADGPEGDPDPLLPEDLESVIEHDGVGVVRAALISGSFDLERARGMAGGSGCEQEPDVVDTPADRVDLQSLADAVHVAFANAQPADALGLLAGALAGSLGPSGREFVRHLAEPLLVEPLSLSLPGEVR